MKLRLEVITNKTVHQVVDYIESNEICTVEINKVMVNESGLLVVSVDSFWDDSPQDFTHFCKAFTLWLFS